MFYSLQIVFCKQREVLIRESVDLQAVLQHKQQEPLKTRQAETKTNIQLQKQLLGAGMDLAADTLSVFDHCASSTSSSPRSALPRGRSPTSVVLNFHGTQTIDDHVSRSNTKVSVGCQTDDYTGRATGHDGNWNGDTQAGNRKHDGRKERRSYRHVPGYRESVEGDSWHFL